MSPAFLDIVVAFALFRRSAINLLIIVTIRYNTAFTPICRAQPHYCLCALSAPPSSLSSMALRLS